MKEYPIEDNKKISRQPLKASWMDIKDYITAHQDLVICCHDVFIKYQDGILLVNRDNYPAKNTLWPIGGRVERGSDAIESLKNKVKNECGLKIKNIKFLGTARTLFKTDPFGHGKGTDTMNLAYSAEGYGKIKLDKLHNNPTIVTLKDYKKGLAIKLHPYVDDFLKQAFKQR